jgi:hypothetical protein
LSEAKLKSEKVTQTLSVATSRRSCTKLVFGRFRIHSRLGHSIAERQDLLRFGALLNSLLSRQTSSKSVFVPATVGAAGTSPAKAETTGSFLATVLRTLRRQRFVPTVGQQRKSSRVHKLQLTKLECLDILLSYSVTIPSSPQNKDAEGPQPPPQAHPSFVLFSGEFCLAPLGILRP